MIELTGLADDAAAALLDALAGTPSPAPPGTPAPEAVPRKRLLEAAGGNPLFLEQLAASLGEQGLDAGGLPLPVTIQALLAARLERLGPGERAVLWRASVVGKDFSFNAIAELLPEEAQDSLGRHLRALVAKGFAVGQPSRRAAGEDPHFQFRHILVQQAAYRAIPSRCAPSCTSASPAGWSASRARGPASTTRSSATTWSRRSAIALSWRRGTRRSGRWRGERPATWRRQEPGPTHAATPRPPCGCSRRLHR